ELGFDDCNGTPCFKGIVPGVTAWEEAKKILPQSSKFKIKNDDGTQVISVYLGQLVLYVRRAGDEYVGFIIVYGLDDFDKNQGAYIPASAADIVDQYGLPCNVDVGIANGGRIITLNYSTLEVGVITDHQRLNSTSAINSVALATNQAFDSPPC